MGVRIFTQDPKRYEKHVKSMMLGVVSFNKADFVESNLPIEGWRRSGKGKYLSALSYE